MIIESSLTGYFSADFQLIKVVIDLRHSVPVYFRNMHRHVLLKAIPNIQYKENFYEHRFFML